MITKDLNKTIMCACTNNVYQAPQFLLQKLPGDKGSKYSNMYLYAYVHNFLLQAMLTYIQLFFSKETNNNEGKFRKIHVFIKIKYE